MKQHLVISALGADRPGIVEQLAEMASSAGCNLMDSRMMSLGSEFAVILLLSGSWDAITRVENTLQGVEETLGLKLIIKRTEPQNFYHNLLPYAVEVVAIDNPGIVHKVCQFFSKKDINIKELETNSYSASHTGTPMFAVNLTIHVPANTPIGDLRDQFIHFCDEMNLDASLEPLKD